MLIKSKVQLLLTATWKYLHYFYYEYEAHFSWNFHFNMIRWCCRLQFQTSELNEMWEYVGMFNLMQLHHKVWIHVLWAHIYWIRGIHEIESCVCVFMSSWLANFKTDDCNYDSRLSAAFHIQYKWNILNCTSLFHFAKSTPQKCIPNNHKCERVVRVCLCKA